MRADTLVLRVGAARDALVVIGAAAPDDLAVLRDRYAAWLDDAMLPEMRDTSPAFAVQLAVAEADRRGVRSLPHLRYGNEVLARASRDDVLDGLDDVLGGIHERAVDDPRPWVQLRVFTDGTRAVLTDTPRPHLVADRELTTAGVREIVSWGVIVDGDHLLVPPPLAGAGGAMRRFELAGAVRFTDGQPSDAETLAALAAHSVHVAWFDAATTLVERGRLGRSTDRAGARIAVQSLLSVAT